MGNNPPPQPIRIPHARTSLTSLFMAFLVGFYSLVAHSMYTSQSFSYSTSAFLFGLSLLGFWLCIGIIPGVGIICANKGLYGRDINKKETHYIPESLGLVCATVYLTCALLFQPLVPEMGHEYNAATMGACFMVLLGFADDVLDLRWRYKIFLSFLATVPLLVAYSGPTDIVVPLPFREAIGWEIVPLGYFYHFYMALIAVFCTNSINIYAGVNGLEVGQSIIIAISVIVFNLIELTYPTQSTSVHGQFISIFLTTPFLACSLGLMVFNAYPSSVFVGDTYTYFAGMVFAVVSILGGFSKTMMLLFLPQLLNFVISIPQLIGIIPCPRHRLPRLNKHTGKLEGIKTNLTLINLVLHITGPMTERDLGILLIILQVLSSVLGLYLRYSLASYFYFVHAVV